jgi:integrase
MRKGRKHGYVIASESLFAETDSYIELHRAVWLHRSSHRGLPQAESPLFIGPRGRTVSKNTYQQVVRLAAERCGFAATTHQLRATFACMMLARLEQLAKTGEPINPLLIVKVLMGHEHIDTTDRYLRAVAMDTHVLADVLESLLPTVNGL